MKSAPILVLFGDPPPQRRGPSGVVISLVLNGFACVLLYLGLHQARTVDSRSIPSRFAVRIMELRKEEPKIQPPFPRAISRPERLHDIHPTTPAGLRRTAAAPRLPLSFI